MRFLPQPAERSWTWIVSFWQTKLKSDSPKVSWARAKATLRGDRMTFGCCGTIGRFSRSCRPNRSMAPPRDLRPSVLASWFLQLSASFVSTSSLMGAGASGAPGVGSSWQPENKKGQFFAAVKAADENEDLTVNPGQQRQSSSRRWWRFISKLCSWETQRARLSKIIHFNGIINPWAGMFIHLSMFKFAQRTWKRSETEDGLSALPALVQVLIDYVFTTSSNLLAEFQQQPELHQWWPSGGVRIESESGIAIRASLFYILFV